MNRTLLHLSLIPGIGPATVARICEVVRGAALDDIYLWTMHDFVTRVHVSPALAEVLINGLRERVLLEQELELIEKHAVRWCTVVDDDYPVLLKQIQYPPTILYWWGADFSVFASSIAFVGARAAQGYARQVVEMLVPDLVKSGFAIVSGGALGADTFAHTATLDAGGNTAAVIGSGLLYPYPASNKRLFMRMREMGGALVSPFPLTMQAMPGNFPARNRIIAGLCKATVVVQAAEKSGALITAFFALEQGREVGAVPGPITDPLSEGCHALLKEGAFLVSSARDILQACGEDSFEHVDKEIDEVQSPLVFSDEIERICGEPQSFDELLEQLDCSVKELQERLFNLQMEGRLTQDFMGRWQRR